MTILARTISWLVGLGLMLSTSGFAVGLRAVPIAISTDNLTGEVLVRLKGATTIYKIQTDKRQARRLAKQYRKLSIVDLAEANQLVRATAIPDDALYSKQYYHNQVFTPDAWDRTQGNKDVVIAIIDSGVDIKHPDLAPNIWQNPREIAGDGLDNDRNGFIDDINGWDFVLNVADPSAKTTPSTDIPEAEAKQPEAPKTSPSSAGLAVGSGVKTSAGLIGLNHGTVVAGVAAARGNNKEGIAGVCWQCKIMAIRILDNSGFGDTINVAKGVDYAIANGASVINLSFVGFDESELMTEAVTRAFNSNVVVVAASGNDVASGGTNLDATVGYPVCSGIDTGKNILLGISALDQSDKKARFSNYGSKCIDISAPGVNFFSTQTQNTALGQFDLYGDNWSGTSMATPLISGGAALLKTLKPSLTNKDIMEALIQGADNIDAINPDYAGKLGTGRLNLFRAVLLALEKKSDAKVGPSAPVSLFLPSSTIEGKQLVVVPAGSLNSDVHIYDMASLAIVKKFTAFSTKFSGGLNVVAGDLENDGVEEIIVASGGGGSPLVKIFDQKGKLKGQFYAGPNDFYGGVNLALEDTDKNGTLEVIVGLGRKSRPAVKIFSAKGKLLKEFAAFPKEVTGGITVTTTEIDGKPVIIAATGPGTIAKARIFNMAGKSLYEFLPFARFSGGLNVSVADLGGDGDKELVFSPATGGGPQIKILSLQGKLLGQYAAFDPTLRGGLWVSSGDILPGVGDEIIAGSGKNSDARVRIFDVRGEKQVDFQPYPTTYRGGVRVIILSAAQTKK